MRGKFPSTPKQDKDQDLQLSVGLKSPTVHRRTATAPTHHLYPHKTGSELLRVGEEQQHCISILLRKGTYHATGKVTDIYVQVSGKCSC